ncbi:hypothetical protein EDD86DRAFT_191821 [Gorgonomyces haynaldii]|nr:hypothetical protein EDD86DRAFT_191821 [Gorgonomyces haynaldii]
MLNKAQKIDISETNIAGLGTELEKKVRLNAAETEKQWTGIGKEVGVRVWRIEQFKVVPVPKEDYGHFFSGDSYVVLWTYKVQDKFKHNVHFWLGLETTQDEAGTAAYKTVELDDYLGGEPVQYREVQGYETDLFLSYFAQFMVSEGGVASGFKHVEPTKYQTRLYHIKGNKNKLVIRQVKLSHTSLNAGDVFLLDKGLELLQWNGEKSNGVEKNKAASFARAIASERKTAKVSVFDQGDKDAKPFWDGIGGEGPVQSAEEGGRDSQVNKAQCKLIQVSDASGKLESKLIATGNITLSQFKSDDVFIFDSGISVYVWVGKKATPEEKKSGLKIAMQYIVDAGLPHTTTIARIIEGGENQEFTNLLVQ